MVQDVRCDECLESWPRHGREWAESSEDVIDLRRWRRACEEFLVSFLERCGGAVRRRRAISVEFGEVGEDGEEVLVRFWRLGEEECMLLWIEEL